MKQKVLIGVYNNISDKPKDYQNYIKNITYFSLLNQISFYKDLIYDKIVEDTSIDRIIRKGSKLGIEWLLIVSYGHRFLNNQVIADIYQTCSKNNSKITGHILQVKYSNDELGKHEYLLHPQCLYLNINTWKNIGKPVFGEPTHTKIIKHIPIRSKDNFHDNYTPYWLKPGKEKQEYEGFLGTGWNLINTALDNNIEIHTFPENIKKAKSHLYPESNYEDLYNVLNGTVDEDSYLKSIKDVDNSKYVFFTETSFKHHQGRSYIFNTEDLGKIDIEEYKENTNLKTIYTTASGFKFLELLSTQQWDKSTEVIFFDYSKPSLNLRRKLIENWDGRDYIGFLKDYFFNAQCECCDTPIKSTYQWYREVDIVEDDLLLRKQFNRIVEYFGGEKKWLELWSKVTSLKYTYLVCDLLNDHTPILDSLKTKPGSSIVWLSNIFLSEPIIRNYQPKFIEYKYKTLIKNLRKINDSIQIIGPPPLTDELYERYTI